MIKIASRKECRYKTLLISKNRHIATYLGGFYLASSWFEKERFQAFTRILICKKNQAATFSDTKFCNISCIKSKNSPHLDVGERRACIYELSN